MLDAVILKFNAVTSEAVVETMDAAACRRYRVPIPSSSSEITVSNASRVRMRYVDHLLNSTPVGRCVTVEPVDQIGIAAMHSTQSMFNDDADGSGDDGRSNRLRLPLANLVHFHESNALTSKSMLPGTVSRVVGRFIFIFCPFLPYEATATRENFSSAGSLTDLIESNDEQPVYDEAQQWIGRSVHFALQPMSYLVMEAFFTDAHGSKNRYGNSSYGNSSNGNSSNGSSSNGNSNGYGGVGFHGNTSLPPSHTFSTSLPWTNTVSHVPIAITPASLFKCAPIGVWEPSGADPSHFFQPELSVRFIHLDGAPLPNNAVPPLLHQGSAFVIELWCFWLLPGTRVTLHALDEDHHDVTDAVLCVELTTVARGNAVAVALDTLEIRAAVSIYATLRTFRLRDGVCELRFALRMHLDDHEGELRSRPVLVRRRRSKVAAKAADAPILAAGGVGGDESTESGNNTRLSPQAVESDSLSRKFWTSDLLSPSDRIVAGFTDPGRSNQLLAADCYESLPMVEREVIIVDPSDERLQSLAAAARRAAVGIVDTAACVQSLAWLVASAFGGDIGTVYAEDEITLLRRQRLANKRRRDFDSQEKDDTGTKEATEDRKRKENRVESGIGVNVVRLGDLRRGVCRHRALLFKYLCDIVALPCYLMRGEHQDAGSTQAERHSWNVVPLEGHRHLLVDTTLSPHELGVWPNAAYRGPPAQLTSDWASTHCITLHRLEDRIHLLEECGRGATAVVRRGVINGGLTCVVKAPRRSSDFPALVREYGVLQQLKGTPGVVQCLGWSGGVVMEYFPTNLLSFMNHLILCEKRMSLSQQREVLLGVMRALKSIHAHGLVHRDVKAENVLVVVIRCGTCQSMGTVCHLCDVRVKLGDLADCVAVQPGTRMHEPAPRVGTVPYTAPEMESEAPFTVAADIWSCGILALEMAQMRLPPPLCKSMPDPHIAEQVNSGEQRHEVTVEIEGRVIGPVVIPPLPRNPIPPSWQREFIESALQVDWRKRYTAVRLLYVLGKSRS